MQLSAIFLVIAICICNLCMNECIIISNVCWWPRAQTGYNKNNKIKLYVYIIIWLHSIKSMYFSNNNNMYIYNKINKTGYPI